MWARSEKFGIWGTFGQTISTHFGTVSSLSLNSIIELVFLQELSQIHISNIYLGLRFVFGPQRISDLAFGCP